MTVIGQAFTAAGYLTGALVFWLMARQRRVATEGFALLALSALCGGVLAAKVVQWGLAMAAPAAGDPIISWPLFFDPRSGGRTILGGVAGGWLAMGLAKKKLGITRSTGDLFAPALAAGEAVGRIGCYFNGCCFGRACNLPWAIYQHGAWRQPTQLYAAAYSALLFTFLWNRRDRWPQPGDAWRAYLLLWAAGRFVVEFYRDQGGDTALLSTAQYFCLALMGVAVASLLRSRTVSSKLPTPPTEAMEISPA